MENNFKQEVKEYFYLYGLLEKKIWNRIPRFIKVYCIKQIFKLRKADMCSIIHLGYGGNEWNLDISTFKDYRIKFKISKLEYGKGGIFEDETKKLILNTTEFSKGCKHGGTPSYYTLEHELFHALQNYLIHMENKPDGFIDYIKYLKAYRDTNDVLISIFDINGYGNLHIKEIGIYDFGNNYINKLSKIFYTLNISERDAFYEAKVKGERFVYEANRAGLGNFEKYDLYGILDEQLSEFKKHYKCYKLSDSQIFTLIDKCFYHLRYNESPEDNLQAVVMYDIAWLSVLQNNSNLADECQKSLDPDIKKKRLKKFGITIPKKSYKYGGFIVVPTDGFNTSEIIYMFNNNETLDIEKLRNSPCSIIDVASRGHKKLVDYINDEEYWKEFCVDNVQYVLSESRFQEVIKISFGKDFLQTLQDKTKEKPQDIPSADGCSSFTWHTHQTQVIKTGVFHYILKKLYSKFYKRYLK